MIFTAKCSRIVRTIPGQSTGGDDDQYVCADGSVWEPISDTEADSTATAIIGYRRNGHICTHE